MQDAASVAPSRLLALPPGLALERPWDVLALVAPPLREAIQDALAGLRVTLEWAPSARAAAARIDARCPSLLLIDTDLVAPGPALTRMALSLHPEALIAGVICYWSEREERLAGAFDALLHKPPRREEWHEALRRLGVPGRVAPSRGAC